MDGLHRRLEKALTQMLGGTDLQTLPKLVLIRKPLTEMRDIWRFFRELRSHIDPESSCVLIHMNFWWQSVFGFFNRKKSWISEIDILNMVRLNGFERVRSEDCILLPFPVPFLDTFFNRFLPSLPGFRSLAAFRIYFLRPLPTWINHEKKTDGPSVSIVVPCRNEKGNIARCVAETPRIGSRTELIFVEGGSNDGTREEIERVTREYKGELELKLYSQPGKGKGDAVREGFEKATCDILMIQDGDLTVPPKELHKFYLALLEGHGDFIMGSRLVYPMEDEAMRTLNILGNKGFSLVFSWLLNRPIKDTLCGTKVLTKKNYEKIAQNRHVFGDFDPFGDYDLIFGAALQNFKIVEIPVRYGRRTYGETNISRFTHGWLLLKMCCVAFRRLKLGL